MIKVEFDNIDKVHAYIKHIHNVGIRKIHAEQFLGVKDFFCFNGMFFVDPPTPPNSEPNYIIEGIEIYISDMEAHDTKFIINHNKK